MSIADKIYELAKRLSPKAAEEVLKFAQSKVSEPSAEELEARQKWADAVLEKHRGKFKVAGKIDRDELHDRTRFR